MRGMGNTIESRNKDKLLKGQKNNMKYRFEVIYKEAHSAGLSPLFTILMIA